MTVIHRRRLLTKTMTQRGLICHHDFQLRNHQPSGAFSALLVQLGFVLALICSPASAYQQTGAPDTAAGGVFSEWLKSFNSADAATITAFNRNHRRQPRALGQTLNLREQTGGFSLLRVEKSEPLSITVLLQETNSDQIGQLELVVDGEDPPKIVRDALLPVSHPTDLS